MSFFASFGNKNSAAGTPPPSAPAIRKVLRPASGRSSPNNKPKPTKPANSSLRPSPQPKKRDSPKPEVKPEVKPDKSRVAEVRRGVKRKSASPSLPAFDSNSEGDSDAEQILQEPKRLRTGQTPNVDLNRKVRDVKNWSVDKTHPFAFTHGRDLTSKDFPAKYHSAFDEDSPEPSEARLQYPSASEPEVFQLIAPNDPDEYKPCDDIIETVKHVLNQYLPSSQSESLLDESHGIPFKLTRALNHKDLTTFTATVSDFKQAIDKARRDGSISSVLDAKHSLPLSLVERILNQVYVRTVSPRVDILKEYKPFSNNTYGELLSPFSSQIFKDTKMDSSSVFVDLGSGVGNVILQAALEIGCESHGIEVMENACKLARAQADEFPARCRLWGISPGSVNLLQGDFLEDGRISRILARADVLLINNQAFEPELNDTLTTLFLDLKEGARIVSLKSFVPAGWRLTERTRDSVMGVLEVSKKEYWSGCVSWTAQGGEYYVAKKDSSRIERILARDRRR